MRPGLALLPLRLFLGVTFMYAGVYKLSDAGFVHAGADTYIGDQLAVAGRFMRAAAVGGLVLSLVLWLTASWHTVPYFLGSDIVFAFAWLPFVLAGADGQPALDNHERSGPLM